MKKFLAMLLIFAMLISFSAYAKSYSSDVLYSLGYLPEELKNKGQETVYRDEFAAVCAAVMGLSGLEPIDTPFTDVKADNPYSGAIMALLNSKIMSGVDENLFAPESPVTGQQALAAFVRILNYEIAAQAYGGWTEGYMRIAQRLRLASAFTEPVQNPLKYSDLYSLIDEVMDAFKTDSNYSGSSGEIIEETFTSGNKLYRQEAFNAYLYEGRVEEIDDKTHSFTVIITESEENAPYMPGESVKLEAASGVNILKYDKAYIEFLSDKDGKLLYIENARNSEVRYAVISSVNGDERENIKYNPSSISEIMLLDDKKEYRAENLSVFYNGKRHYQSISLKDKYARIVFLDEKISSIEIWDLNEGGLITDINYNTIVFTRGTALQRLNEIDSFERRMLVVDGENRDITELKADTVFDYYIDKDKDVLIIFASEKKISDTYVSYASDSIEIGNLSLLRAPIIYGSFDGKQYKAQTLNELINKNVTAYVDVKERVRYVCAFFGEAKRNVFAGYFMGYEEGRFSSLPEKFKIVNLDSEDFEEKIYPVSKKFSTDESLSDVYLSAGLKDGTPIYDFKVNDSGEIISLEKKPAFYGFADANGEAVTQSIGSFPQSAFPFMWVGGRRLYFDDDVKIVGMFESDGELVFKRTTWNRLSGRICDNSIVARFFGEEKSSDVDMIFMSGPLESITPSEYSYGVVTEVSAVKLDDGEYGKKVVINNEGSYVLTENEASGITENTFISYGSDLLFGKSEICILNSLNLTGDMYDWVGLNNSDVTIKTGTVEKADGKRVYFTDGSEQFINRSQPMFFSVSEKCELKNASYMDNLEGKDIVYAADNNLIYAVFFSE